MAKFFKKLGKGIANASTEVSNAIDNSEELSRLDKIVKDLHKQCDAAFKVKIDELKGEFNNEDTCSKIEESIFDQLNQEYDRRVKKLTGREIPSTWKTDKGKANEEVRKRILNRGFEKKRNTIFLTIQALSAGIKESYDLLISQLKVDYDEFYSNTKKSLPIKRKELQKSIDDNKISYLEKIALTFPGGLKSFNDYSDSVKDDTTKEIINDKSDMMLTQDSQDCFILENITSERNTELIKENSEMISTKCSELRQEYLVAYLSSFHDHVDKIRPFESSISESKGEEDNVNPNIEAETDILPSLIELNKICSPFTEEEEREIFTRSVGLALENITLDLKSYISKRITDVKA